MNQPSLNPSSKRAGVKHNSRSNLGKLVGLFMVASVVGITIVILFFTQLGSGWQRTLGLDNVKFPGLGNVPVFATLKGEGRDRTNFLVVGRDYDRNTDTILVISYYYKEKQIATLNLPRDMVVNDGFGTKKINAVWSDADTRFQNKLSSEDGKSFLAGIVSKILDIPIDYTAMINIEGVAKVIDTLGGVEVVVDNAFSDCEYPTPNYQEVYYPNLRQRLPYLRPCPAFKPGLQTMDSKTALIFARSRKSFDNPQEAIDFARSKRQTKVIEGVISKASQKVKDGSLLLNPGQITSIIGDIQSNLDTNMNTGEMLKLFSLVSSEDMNKQIAKYTLDYDRNILCSPQDGSSNIELCGGTVLGASNNSLPARKLKKVASNLLQEAKNRDLTDKKVAIVGNNSDFTGKVVQQLQDLGFGTNNILTDNSFRPITRATVNSTEKATIYIPDLSTLELFNSSGFDIDSGSYNIVNQKQTKFVFSENYASADIIILIEPSTDNQE